jgi:hypothetical protein
MENKKRRRGNPGKKKEDMFRKINVSIPPDLFEWLEEMAAKGFKKSRLVTEGLRYSCDKHRDGE